MKKIIIAAAMLLALVGSNRTWAQIDVQFNIGLQPLWGPVGYDYAEYYYIPDIDVYYDVAHETYIYPEGGRWVTVRSLPGRYRNFDLYRAHKVVVNDRNPWLRHDYYRTQYAQYRGRHDQTVIRDSREQRYWANPRHPMHNRWRDNDDYGRRYERSREWQGYRRGHGHDHDWDRHDNRKHHGHGH